MIEYKEFFKQLLEAKFEDDFFCREGCPEFGIALHDLLDYDIKLLIDQDGQYDNEMPGEKRKIFPALAHVFAEDKQGNYYDIYGKRSLSKMIDQFELSDPKVQDVSRDELISDYMGLGKPFYGLDNEVLEFSKEKIKNNPEKYQ